MVKAHHFESYANQVTDLLIDSYKWMRLSQNAADEATRVRYRKIAETLHSLYHDECEHLRQLYKEG